MRNQVPKMYESSAHWKTSSSRYGSFHSNSVPSSSGSSSTGRHYGSPTRSSHASASPGARPARILPFVPTSAAAAATVAAPRPKRATSASLSFRKTKEERADEKRKEGRGEEKRKEGRGEEKRKEGRGEEKRKEGRGEEKRKEFAVQRGESRETRTRVERGRRRETLILKRSSSTTRPLPVGPSHLESHPKIEGYGAATSSRLRRTTTGSSEIAGSPSAKSSPLILRADHSITKATAATTTVERDAVHPRLNGTNTSCGNNRTAGQYSPSSSRGSVSSGVAAPVVDMSSTSAPAGAGGATLQRTKSVSDLSASFSDRLHLTETNDLYTRASQTLDSGATCNATCNGAPGVTGARREERANANNSSNYGHVPSKTAKSGASVDGGVGSGTGSAGVGVRASPLRERDRERSVGRTKNNDVDTNYSSTGTSVPTKNGTHLESCGLKGLRNLGNTCFMNSVIQCLSNTRQLLEFSLNDSYSTDVNKTTSSMKGQLMLAFAHLLQDLWKNNSSEGYVSPSSFKSAIAKFAPRFTGYAQQDAQEFLRYLLQGLAEDVNRVTTKPKPVIIDEEEEDRLSDLEKAAMSWKRYLRLEDSRIGEIFVGQLKSTLKCTTCGYASVTFDPFWDLSLPLPKSIGASSLRGDGLSLHSCMALFTKEEILDGDERPKCAKCKQRRKCTKSFSIQRFPRVLVLHLKRFAGTSFRAKLSTCVDFPHTLDLTDFAADAKALTARPAYNLYAVSNHSGSTHSGHYTAYCRHPYSNAWYYYNDSRVSKHSKGSVCTAEGYVLFYENVGH